MSITTQTLVKCDLNDLADKYRRRAEQIESRLDLYITAYSADEVAELASSAIEYRLWSARIDKVTTP